ncbi:transporter, major facilitator family protein [Necator americanus]|uniref:Transporter, major facilitator family protein n=1 Tax=Necator americanus TaxID=51031 RepID=W2SML0_NECAM|nr:transporter, major facilitator family protein [Necator americanus]ETN70106.1 transporter, major facilitator family protein [Necator americanus]
MDDVRSDYQLSLSTNGSDGTRTMALYGMVTTFATLGFPIAVRAGFAAVFAMRILQGISTALSFPATGLIPSQWSTLKAAGSFIAILSCHVQFCNIFTMPVAGFLCESSLGWPSVFYLQGILTALAFTTFFFFYEDDPSLHRAIITDPCILGVWLSTIGGNLGFQIFLLYGPTYMNKVLHFDVKSTGFATALPFILSAVVKFVVGPISDRATFIPGRWRLIFFAAFSQGMMAVCILLLAFVTSPRLGQITYTAAIVFSGINVVGVVKCAQLVARQHVHFVMTVISFLLCIIILLIPVAVNIVCPDNTPEQWSNLFLGISIIVVVANAPFAFLARSDPAPWTGSKIHAVLQEKIDRSKIEDLTSDPTLKKPKAKTRQKESKKNVVFPKK